MEVTAGLAESNGSLLPGLWRDSLHVTCGLTACTRGSAPGPTLGNEYGKTLPFLVSNEEWWRRWRHATQNVAYMNMSWKWPSLATSVYIFHCEQMKKLNRKQHRLTKRCVVFDRYVKCHSTNIWTFIDNRHTSVVGEWFVSRLSADCARFLQTVGRLNLFVVILCLFNFCLLNLFICVVLSCHIRWWDKAVYNVSWICRERAAKPVNCCHYSYFV